MKPAVIVTLLALSLAAGTAWADEWDSKIRQFTASNKSPDPGDTIKFTIVVSNEGTAPWPDKGVVLVVENLRGPSGTKEQQDEFRDEVSLPPVAPNETFRCQVELTAPSIDGDWLMGCFLTKGGKWFGDQREVDIAVKRDIEGEITDVAINEDLEPGQKTVVQVVVKNTGKGVWLDDTFTVKCEVKRTVSGDGKSGEEAFEWESRAIAVDIPPGGEHELEYDVTAPELVEVRSIWELEWSIVDGKTGKVVATEVVKVEVDGDISADVTDVDVEDGMTPGKSYKVTVKVKNTGELTWSGDDYVLTCENTGQPKGAKPSDDMEFEEEISGDVEPGETATITGYVEAPTWSGEWELRVQMNFDGKGISDEEDVEVTVKREIDADINSVRLPSKWQLGRTAEIRVKVRNSGDAAWNDGPYAIVFEVKRTRAGEKDQGKKSFTFSVPVKKGLVVEPGKQYEFRIKRPVPKSPGEWEVLVRMKQGRRAFFGDKKTVKIVVP